MKHTFLTLLAAALCCAAAGAAAAPPVRLHTVDEMNRTVHTPDSHAGEERWSVLEPVYGYRQLIGSDVLRADRTAIYPRVKRMADGRYILFYQGGQIASRIYYTTSSDLLTWSPGVPLFEPYAVTTAEGPDTRCFSTADAVVLDNGDLLVACSFRASAGYKNNVGCGLVVRRSADNGRTWSDESVIFEGANWEPYLLQLPDGRIQCYFTDCLPATRNSGTSVLTSTDGGYTWHGHMRVCRQYKYNDRGVEIFTDQMPCFRLLNDGETLFGFLEARLEPDGPQGRSTYMMSVVRNRGCDWQPLGELRAGPDTRETNVVTGCAGYVALFPSGETLISCNIDRRFSLKLGDCRGERFNGSSWADDWLQPFDGLGFWGSLEPVDGHRVIGAMHCDAGIQFGLFHLNHRIGAPRLAVQLDGDGAEWLHDEALFLGSDSPAQAIFRAAHDDARLYLLAECKALPEHGSVELRVGDAVLTAAADGTVTAPEGVACVWRAAATAAGEPGFVVEASFPLEAAGDRVPFTATLRGEGLCDTFTFADPADPDTWMRIALQ